MNTDKLNELIGEVIHLACAAELASDEQIKIQAIGDIYDAIASVLPVEHAARSVVTPIAPRFASSATPRGIFALPSDGRAAIPFAAAKRTKIRSINGLATVIAKADVCGRKFYAEAGFSCTEDNKWYEEGFLCTVYEDRKEGLKDVCKIEFPDHVGSNAVEKILRGILSGISSHYGHKSRKKANRRARLALTVKEG